MIMLVFSMPFTTIAQQNVINAKAVIDAKKDAAKDVNEVLWFLAGCVGGTSLAGATLMSVPMVGTSTNDEAGCVGLLACLFSTGTGMSAIFRSSSPPPKRLLGRSPEYVNSYVDTYANSVKLRRIIPHAAGFGTGCIGLFVVVLNFTDF